MAGVSCIISKGDIPLDIKWTFNSNNLLSSNTLTLTKLNTRTSALSIDSLDGYHRGVYTCIASNKAGKVEHSAELFVNGENLNLKN